MAGYIENTERAIAVLDRMANNIRAKGVVVPTNISAEAQADKILDISGGGPQPTTGEYAVRFISPINIEVGGVPSRLLSTVRANRGEYVPLPADIISPDPDLVFTGWTHTVEELSNIQHDIDVGAQFETVDGATIVDFELTPVTGLSPTLYFTLTEGTELLIDRGDGQTDTVTSSPYNPTYTNYGRYRMKIRLSLIHI